MSNRKFETGDRVENVKSQRVGFIKKQRGQAFTSSAFKGLVNVNGSKRRW
jgi:hypothetical protein